MNHFYTRHIFFCNNVRKDNKPCCSQHNAKALYRHAKDRCRDQGLLGQGRVGVSESRCLGRCAFGPVAVVYPDNVWYRYESEADVDRIIDQHLIGGQVVEFLQID